MNVLSENPLSVFIRLDNMHSSLTVMFVIISTITAEHKGKANRKKKDKPRYCCCEKRLKSLSGSY